MLAEHFLGIAHYKNTVILFSSTKVYRMLKATKMFEMAINQCYFGTLY